MDNQSRTDEYYRMPERYEDSAPISRWENLSFYAALAILGGIGCALAFGLGYALVALTDWIAGRL